jgi:hypothetical protein
VRLWNRSSLFEQCSVWYTFVRVRFLFWSFVCVCLFVCFEVFKMPDQKICHDGHRSVELQEFDHLAARCHGSPGLRTPSLRADRCDLNRVSAAFLAKDFDVKSVSPCAGGGVANGVSPLSTLLNTAQSQPLAKPSSTPASAAAPVSDSAAKASVASLKIAPRRGRPLKTVRAGPVL